MAVCWVAVACSDKPADPGQPGTAGNTSQGAAGNSASTAGSAGTVGSSAGTPGTGGAQGGQVGTSGTGGAPSGGLAGSSNTSAGTAPSGGSSTGGAASTAGSGGQTGGTAGSGGSSTAAPVATATGYSFTFGDVVMEINTQVGARVSKLAIAGSDLIMTSATDPTTWGSVFWTSPRADWRPDQWPPPVAIDNAAYTASLSGTHVVATGPVDDGQGTSMAKDYSVDAATGWITLAYTVKASKALKAAPWEISRVPRGGLVFFPKGTGALTPGPLTITQTTSQSLNIAWFDDAPKTATSPDGDKCYGDGAGWTAYVINGNLFLKKFVDQPATAQASGE
ncbi:MAG TPA: hypothetical protein VEQ59_04425, partial [Polyangiaceae bacterium]|nr:hypothetical protein [Polyangiaceae bacterium]